MREAHFLDERLHLHDDPSEVFEWLSYITEDYSGDDDLDHQDSSSNSSHSNPPMQIATRVFYEDPAISDRWVHGIEDCYSEDYYSELHPSCLSDPDTSKAAEDLFFYRDPARITRWSPDVDEGAYDENRSLRQEQSLIGES